MVVSREGRGRAFERMRPERNRSDLTPEEAQEIRRRKAQEEAIVSPFPEQYCPDCNEAYGRFMGAKRKVLRQRYGHKPDNIASFHSLNPDLLTTEEMARVKSMIPEHIEHLDTCKANQGGFDAED